MNRSLGRNLWLVFLTGIPFAVYKFGVGWFCYQNGHVVPGILGMLWGIVDLILNLLSLFCGKQVKHCLLSNIGHRIDVAKNQFEERRWEGFCLGLDTLAALVMVSGMIWFGDLPLQPAHMGLMWNVAVVANLLGAGMQQVWVTAPRRREL